MGAKVGDGFAAAQLFKDRLRFVRQISRHEDAAWQTGAAMRGKSVNPLRRRIPASNAVVDRTINDRIGHCLKHRRKQFFLTCAHRISPSGSFLTPTKFRRPRCVNRRVNADLRRLRNKNTENEYVTPDEEGHPVDERIRLLMK